MRSCSTVNIPLAIKIKPQMVIDYQQHKKQLEKERALILLVIRHGPLAQLAEQMTLNH